MKQKIIDTSKLNLIIDIIMLMLMMLIAGIGFLMKYVLVAGYERNIIHGGNVNLMFCGKTHHEWGTIHLILSIVFLLLLVLHIILHWKMIVSIFKRIVPNRTTQITLVSLFSILSLLSISFPLFVSPNIVEKEALYRNSQINKSLHTINPKEKNVVEKNPIPIHENKKAEKRKKRHIYLTKGKIELSGSKTLQFVADKYNVPVSVIESDLKIPKGFNNERLGRLKKLYSFHMNDVRASIAKYKESEN
jgi:hypothetical protein